MDWIMNWWWATILGPVVLGGVLIYALVTRRKLSKSEKASHHQAVDKLYHDTPGNAAKADAIASTKDNRPPL